MKKQPKVFKAKPRKKIPFIPHFPGEVEVRKFRPLSLSNFDYPFSDELYDRED